MPELSEQNKIDRGRQAARFKIFISENPYFKQVIEELKDELLNDMKALAPRDKETWSYMQAAFKAMDMPLERVDADILIGQMEEAKLEGNSPKGGIV